ncbi:MAG: O-antigen polysaccharide polymerase Wzy [Prevotella sp.]|nr:O-antigen polysaccharide polymerase Wzy [Prevotella sp.]
MTIKLYLCFIISAILLAVSGNSIELQIFSLILLALGACLEVKFDVYHPLCMYVGMFTLYCVAYPILHCMIPNIIFGYDRETSICMWTALAVCIIILPKKRLIFSSNYDTSQYADYLPFLKKTTYLCSFISYLTLIVIVVKGYSGKSQIYTEGGLFLNLSVRLLYYNLFFYTFYLIIFLGQKIKIDKFWLTFNLFLYIAFGSITGERNFTFHSILVTGLLFFMFGILSKKSIPMLTVLGVVSLAASKVFKYYFLRGEASGEVTSDNLIILFLTSDFSSGGRNLQALVGRNTEGIFGIQSLVIDFSRIFFKVDDNQNTLRWFNDIIMPLYGYDGGGKGFTIIGEGYVSMGIIGIVIVMSMVALFLRYLYLHSTRSAVSLALYIYMLPQCIYASRQDMICIFSPFIKHALLGFILLKFFKQIFVSPKKQKILLHK